MPEGDQIFVGIGRPKEIPLSGPREVLLILGQGVKPQLRHGGQSEDRHVVIGSAPDSQILRIKTLAAAELVAHGFIDGPIVPTGANTASSDSITAAREQWNKAGGVADPTFSYIQRQEFIGNPQTEEEANMVSETTEAGLMADFLQKVTPRSHDVAREKRLPIRKEEKARNTVQNVIYLLNMLDTEKGLFEGTVKVISSNDGHLDRGVAVLRAFGITDEKIVPIAAEPVLEHYQYGKNTRDDQGQNFLDRMKVEESKDDWLKGQGKWLEMIKRVPAYMLPELTKLTNDDRLRSVIGAMQAWYKQSDVDVFAMYPQLSAYQSMPITELRAALTAIPRDTNTGPWEQFIDYDGMRQQIAKNSAQTLDWIGRRGK